jgi:hypothetical protein
MNPTVRTTLLAKRFRPVLIGSLLAALTLAGPLSGNRGARPTKEDAPKETGRASSAPVAVEVRFTDNSSLKLTLRDERLAVYTPYGRLLIPIAEIRRIDFATRIPEEDTKRIDAAIANLASPQFKLREAATAELQKQGVKAYPALLRATQESDAEVVRRAEELLDKIRETVPEEQLVVREHDVIHTEHSKISGHIAGSALKASTFQFGEVELKLVDMHGLRSMAVADETENPKAAPDPGNLIKLQDQIGKTYFFKVTGSVTGSIWGTGVYTTDSPLAVVAVHAGLLKPGQTKVIRVTIVAAPASFSGSTQNGVTSAPYELYPGAYRVSR